MPAYTLQYFDGSFSTPVPVTRAPVLEFPFAGLDVPDLNPRHLTRRFLVEARTPYRRIATRTSYTNQLTWSEDFSNAAWTKTNVTQVAAQLANPWDGTLTYSKLLETAANAEHRLERAYTFTAVPHTLSALVAAGLGRNFVRLMSYDGTTFRSAFFDLANGQVFGTPSGCTAALRRYVTPAGAVSYRAAITFTPLAAAGSVYLNASTDGATVSYAGDTAKGFHAGGLQLELAAAAGPYAVTTTAARTVSVPDVDGFANSTALDADDFAFLTAETDTTEESAAPAAFTRRYSRLPATQYEPLSLNLVRPLLHDIFSGSSYAVSFDNRDSWIFSARTTISALGTPDVPNTANPDNGSTPGVLPHVLISITANSGTQTFYADDDDTTIKNAVCTAATGSTAAAANFKILRNIGSLTVTVITSNTTVSALSSAGASVTVDCPYGMALATGAGPGTIVSLQAAAANAASVRRVTTSIAAVAGRWMALWNGDKLVATGKVVATNGSTYADIELSEIPGKDFAATHAAVAGVTASTRVATGPIECSARRTSRFYLPGFTPAVDNRADVPVFNPATRDPVSWLGVLVAYIAAPSEDTYAVDATEALRQFAGPILEKAIVEIQVKDAYVTVSATA